MVLPIKQGLKLMPEHCPDIMAHLAMALPIKQGLKRAMILPRGYLAMALSNKTRIETSDRHPETDPETACNAPSTKTRIETGYLYAGGPLIIKLQPTSRNEDKKCARKNAQNNKD